MLLRIEVRNMKKERFNRLLVRDVRLFFSFVVSQRNSSCFQRRFLEFHALQTRTTLSSETYQNVAKKFKLPGYPRLKAMVKYSCARTKKSQHQWLLFQKLNMRVLLFFQPLAPTEAMQLCHLNIKVNECNNRKPSFTQFWPHFTNCLFPSIFEDRHT